MSMTDKPTSENTSRGGRLRTLLSAVLSSILQFMTANPQSTGKGGSAHLGRRRAIRLRALLAPSNRGRLVVTAGLVIIVGAALGAIVNQPTQPAELNNAIWLDRTWTYGPLDESRLAEFANRMIENRIGRAFAYVSSLSTGDRWLAGLQGEDGFMDLRGDVAQFVSAFKMQHEQLELLAWLEIWTHLDSVDGYRLDDQNLQQNIADLCRLLVTELGFDGVLLDIKPLFSDDDNLFRLIRSTRTAIGLDKPIAIAVTADLTPDALQEQSIQSIAPGTMWSNTFKQRVMASADEIVLLMYQSYRQVPLDYINWVAYHVETYLNLLETGTKIYVSVPNYDSASPAHNPEIETMQMALDGVREGLRRLDDEQRELLAGIAIYTDEPLSQSDWDIYREHWLQR